MKLTKRPRTRRSRRSRRNNENEVDSRMNKTAEFESGTKVERQPRSRMNKTTEAANRDYCSEKGGSWKENEGTRTDSMCFLFISCRRLLTDLFFSLCTLPAKIVLSPF